MTTVPAIYACDSGASFYDFDLNKNTIIILAGVNQANSTAAALDDLPADTIISYHLTNTDAIGNTAALSILQTISSADNGKQIFVRIQNPITLCYETRSFQLNIVAKPQITNTPADSTLCARNLSENPLKANFNLTSQIASIVGLQNTAYNFISYYRNWRK
jgi:hypothetical protein